MKKIITLVHKAQIGAKGTLFLALLFIIIHALAIIFNEYGILPLFYGLVFMALMVNMYLEWTHRYDE